MQTQAEALELQKIILERALEIVEAKRKDYSGDVDPYGNFRKSAMFKVEPWRGVLVRLTDKMSRLATILERHGVHHVKDESLWDLFPDLINYPCILAGLACEELGTTVEDVRKAYGK